MVEANEMKALVERIENLETQVAEAHKNINQVAGWHQKTSDDYYKMMQSALYKYGVLKDFAETAGPIIIACDKALFPEKAIERAKRLTFLLQDTPSKNN
jgi:hypothetical protein